jgi:AcrR family transcriptional regulator
VTVAEVALRAEVAVATVFNYFPTKEDLFFFRLEAFGPELVDAIRDRTVEEPAPGPSSATCSGPVAC